MGALSGGIATGIAFLCCATTAHSADAWDVAEVT